MNEVGYESSYIPIHFGKEATIFMKQTGLWLLANVDQKIGWPQKNVVVIYRGQKILLLPATKSVHAAAAIITKDPRYKEGKVILMQFLSALAYAEEGKIDIVRWTNSSMQGALSKHLRLPLVKQRGMTHLFFRPTELPNPADPKARQALAFFREGLNLNHVGYSFLSYYKIINMKYPHGSKQKEWIRQSIPALQMMHHLKDKINQLMQKYSDLADYIYRECRCAVAHASMLETTFDPESIEDQIRFNEMTPIVHALAKTLIENEFGVKSKFTILSEHLYELEGFILLFGKNLVDQFKLGQTIVSESVSCNIKEISLRIWNKKKFKAFENLTPTIISIKNGIVSLNLTRDGTVLIPLILDFPRERLIFDPFSIILSDNGSKNAASQLADFNRFLAEIIANGVLEVWDTSNHRILGRLLEYLPVNIMVGQTKKNLIDIEMQWRAEAKKRPK